MVRSLKGEKEKEPSFSQVKGGKTPERVYKVNFEIIKPQQEPLRVD